MINEHVLLIVRSSCSCAFIRKSRGKRRWSIKFKQNTPFRTGTTFHSDDQCVKYVLSRNNHLHEIIVRRHASFCATSHSNSLLAIGMTKIIQSEQRWIHNTSVMSWDQYQSISIRIALIGKVIQFIVGCFLLEERCFREQQALSCAALCHTYKGMSKVSWITYSSQDEKHRWKSCSAQIVESTHNKKGKI